MKTSYWKLSIYSVLLSATFSQSAMAALSCRHVLTNEAAASMNSAIASINLDKLNPQELKDINSKISELEGKIRDRGYRRSTLEKNLAGDITIPYSEKTDAIIELERKMREERDALEREEKAMPTARVDLISAIVYLDKQANKTTETPEVKKPNNGGGPTFDDIDFNFSKPWEKKWTQEDVDSLKKRIGILENNIPIRQKNLVYYKKKYAEVAGPLLEVVIAKVKEELNELVKKDDLVKEEILVLQNRRNQLLESLKADALHILKQVMSDKRLATPINDLLGFHSLKNLPTANKVTVLIGSNINGENRIEYNQAEQVKQLVQGLVKKQYYVVFDAESSYAPYIAQLSGEYGIPVMSKEQGRFANHKNKVVISNDYLRMQILADAQAVVATPDSITGMGLYTEGLLTHVLDSRRKFETTSLRTWVADLDQRSRNLGITSRSVKTLDKASELFEVPATPSFGKGNVDKSVESFKTFVNLKPESLGVDSVKKVINEGSSFAQAIEMNRNTGGSVIFGSSREDKYSANLIYQSAYKLGRLGIAVATGGAGGAMEIANSGAYNAGGVSVGIPIGGKHMLENEQTVSSSKHTRTISTAGYEERIPVLLDSRKLVIFVPGGNGTIKELAVTLVKAAGKFNSFEKIVFLDSDYYKPLVDWLKASALPQALKDKIVLLDKASDVEALGLEVQEGFEKARVQEPRKDKLTWEVKTYESSYSGGGFFGSSSSSGSSSSGSGSGPIAGGKSSSNSTTTSSGSSPSSSSEKRPSPKHGKPGIVIKNSQEKGHTYETWQYPPVKKD